MAYKFVGKAVPRLEGADKVSGKTRYAADIEIPGALWAKILRSSLPHARIVNVDTSKAAKLGGFHAITRGANIPPVMTGLRMKDMPLLARERVRFVGEPIAAVAADTVAIADEALNLIDVRYEELPYVTDPLKAIEPGAPVLHDNPAAYKNAPERATELPNIQSYGQWSNGDVDAGFKNAARIFEHTFRTPLGFHAYIEPHACTVRINHGDQIEIWASNKAPFTLRDRFARDFNLDPAKIKVHILPVGGDFGGKNFVIEMPVFYFFGQRTRTPGSPQTTFAMESQIDIIARELGMNPVEFRLNNLLDDGDITPFGQKLKGIIVKETLKRALDVSGWKRSKATNTGRGVAVYERPSGAGRSGAAITIESDGSVTVNLGVPDVGPGIHTVVQQIVSEVLDLERERVKICVEDTDRSPYDSGTGGSKSTNSVGTAAYQAVSELKEKLISLAAARLGYKPEELQESN